MNTIDPAVVAYVLAEQLPARIGSRWPYMNYGGCAKFALRLWDALYDAGIPCTAYLVGYSSYLDREDPEWVDTCRVDHIVVGLPDAGQWDSEGNNEEPLIEELSYDELQLLVGGHGWNQVFTEFHGDEIWPDVAAELLAIIEEVYHEAA